jgi:hypothetical protein
MKWTTRYTRILVALLIGMVGLLIALRVAKRVGAAVPAATILTAAGPGVTVHSILPSAADPSLTGTESPNVAIVRRHAHFNGLLLVFLPGTGGKPGCCELYLRAAASLGYHAVGLTYDNQTAVGIRCLNDLSCFGTVRRNEFDGTDPSAFISLQPRQGIEHRLASLLSYLAKRHPREGWRGFLRHGMPDWGRIVMSGHSQGGGEAAFIGTIKRLRGVVTLSSPPDTNLSHVPATWVAGVPHGRTPLDRFVGFVHSGDPFYARIIADWQAMNLSSFGALRSVDGARPPYRHAHELISSAPLPLVILATHDSTAVDSATPSCANGSAEYAPVWDYMLEVAGGLRMSMGHAGC